MQKFFNPNPPPKKPQTYFQRHSGSWRSPYRGSLLHPPASLLLLLWFRSASSDPACPNSSSSSSYPNSSDPSSSSSYASPVQYPHQFVGGGTHFSGSPAHFGNTSGTQFGGTAPGGHFRSTSSGAGGNSFGAGGPPGSGTPILHHSPLHLLSAVESHYGGAGAHQREPQHHQGGTLLHQGSPQWGGHHHSGGTQKKRSTLVKYRYPDVLPSNNTNQNYYV